MRSATEGSIPCNRETETRLERRKDGIMRTGRERQQRNLGIDLLRIFCMFLICILQSAGREERWSAMSGGRKSGTVSISSRRRLTVLSIPMG